MQIPSQYVFSNVFQLPHSVLIQPSQLFQRNPESFPVLLLETREKWKGTYFSRIL